MIYRPRYFGLQELVSPEIFGARGERAWELLDVYLLVSLDQIRAKFGRMTVNDWHWGGRFKYSGMRPMAAADVQGQPSLAGVGPGSPWSMHRFGRGADPKPQQATAQEIHAYILTHQDEFPHIRVLEKIEDTPTWVHIDTRNHTRDGIWVVNG